MFAQQIGKTMEVYINNMLVKNFYVSNHLAHLPEMFNILPTYHMKINANKCVFRVSSRTFLGFIVNQRGIEANLDKIKAVLKMEAPQILGEVQHLT